MVSRRSTLIGLGGLMVGGGALVATGAFTQVEAQRTMTVETAGDADAFLGLRVDADLGSVDEDGMIVFEIDDTFGTNGQGLNRGARTTFAEVLGIINNGTEDIVLSFAAELDTGEDVSEIFSFEFHPDGNLDTPAEGNEITSQSAATDDPTDYNDDGTAEDSPLGAGEPAVYDLVAELRDEEVSPDLDEAPYSDIVDDGPVDIVLTIEANAA